MKLRDELFAAIRRFADKAPRPAPVASARKPKRVPPWRPRRPGGSLEALVATDRSPINAAQLDAAAQRLGVEPEHIRAVAHAASAGQAFAGDARAIIRFDAAAFWRLTGRDYDAAHPSLSPGVEEGLSQAERWARLTEAFELDPNAALHATAWGLFQIGGERHASAGYKNVHAMAADLSRSAYRQLVAFEGLVRAEGLSDLLGKQEWESFARRFNGDAGAEKYALALREAYAAAKRVAARPFLQTLAAKNPAPLTPADIAAAAQRMQVENAALQAILKVESRGGGFGPDGRPVILFEPHVFSRLTGGTHDAAHPSVSYRVWNERPYPRTQGERYQQLAEAYGLDVEAALAAASWGLFQIQGQNFRACGFPSPSAFVADMAQSEARMLAAFEAFVRANNILEDLQRRDWAGFARIYNGPAKAELYGARLAEAYAAAQAMV